MADVYVGPPDGLSERFAEAVAVVVGADGGGRGTKTATKTRTDPTSGEREGAWLFYGDAKDDSVVVDPPSCALGNGVLEQSWMMPPPKPQTQTPLKP